MRLFPTARETITGTAAALRAGETTCVEVVETCLRRIDEREEAVRAWVLVDRDAAIRRAHELDAELKSGRLHGPLHGIPVGIKDIVDVKGLPTAAGFGPWTDRIAGRDATLVSRLRGAGAIVLGKTVTTQFASYDPPVTRNPWNLERTPGGSSSGSAAAVAAGMCLGAIGTQTGGSITRPASFCGVAGCKPTFRRVSLYGVLPLAWSLDHAGPIARRVADLAVMLDAISGHDYRDPQSADELPTRLSEARQDENGRPPVLGRLHGLFDELAEPVMRAAFDDALRRLTNAGAKSADAALPDAFDDVLERHATIMAVEAAAVHRERFAEQPGEFGPAIRGLIEDGVGTAAPEYVLCRRHQESLRREIVRSLDDVDVLVCPAALGPAPDVTSTGNPAFNSPWSYTGLPTVSLPIGTSDDGLPLAMQLVGRPFGEAALFRAAAWCERVMRDER